MTPQIFGLDTYGFRRHLQRPECPRCGDTLTAAEASELVARGHGSHIRNSWSCDSCGHDFVTAVQLSPVLDSMDDPD